MHETFQLCLHFTYFVDRIYDIIKRTGTLPEFMFENMAALAAT